MQTIIYIMRHSIPIKNEKINAHSNDSFQIKNEKIILSIEGEKLAEDVSKIDEFKNFDLLYSSNYVRAIETAKYFLKVGMEINIDDRLGERQLGFTSPDDIDEEIICKQFNDWNYKVKNGDSLNDVNKRMTKCIQEIVMKNKGKKIIVISHGMALKALIKTWCDLKYFKEDNSVLICKNKRIILKGFIRHLDGFKLTFENDELINIDYLKKY